MWIHLFDSADLLGLKMEFAVSFANQQLLHVNYGGVALHIIHDFSKPLLLFHHGISLISSRKSSCGVHISGQV